MASTTTSTTTTTIPLVTIGIAGGAGAGKTTLARKLFDELGQDTNVTYLFHDSYYKDLSHLTMEERAKNNFDHPDSLETDLLVQHIQQLKQGCTVVVPMYDFTTHSRSQFTVHAEPRKVIVVEGILLFCYPELLKELDLKVFVDADSDIRLARRISRDVQERGRTVDQVLVQYKATVRPMHNAWVEPSKACADLIVNTMAERPNIGLEVLANHLRLKAGLIS